MSVKSRLERLESRLPMGHAMLRRLERLTQAERSSQIHELTEKQQDALLAAIVVEGGADYDAIIWELSYEELLAVVDEDWTPIVKRLSHPAAIEAAKRGEPWWPNLDSLAGEGQ